MKQTTHWIKSKLNGRPNSVIEFPPLPGGEGRSERKYYSAQGQNPFDVQRSTFPIPCFPSFPSVNSFPWLKK
jgi:hypothetical protein